MAQATLLGIQPENEQGCQFEVDAETWLSLRRILFFAGLLDNEETAKGLLCLENGARCDVQQARIVADQLEFLVENCDPGTVVAVTAITFLTGEKTGGFVEFLDNRDLGIPLNTIAALEEFLRGSQGFVIKSQLPTPDGNVIQ